MSDVFASCISSPLSVNLMPRFFGSRTNSFGTMKGPSGAKVSWDLPMSQSVPRRLSPRPPRSETSF
jgi:hypothetical protein